MHSLGRVGSWVPQATVTLLLLAVSLTPTAQATSVGVADQSINEFLKQDDTQHPYKARRRLEAVNGSRRGWLEAVTEYSPATGFRYHVVNEGGSGLIRDRVLRGVLEGERDAIAKGETSRSSLDRTNYLFQVNGLDADGLANIRVMPRRKDRTLVDGTMFLTATTGDLVRLTGRLAKSPSFWVKNVEIARSYARLNGVVVPVALTSTADVRFLGAATLRMTYEYSEIDGRLLQ